MLLLLALMVFMVTTIQQNFAGGGNSKSIDPNNIPLKSIKPRSKKVYWQIANAQTLKDHAPEKKVNFEMFKEMGFLEQLAEQRLSIEEIEEAIDTTFDSYFEESQANLERSHYQKAIKSLPIRLATYKEDVEKAKPLILDLVLQNSAFFDDSSQ